MALIRLSKRLWREYLRQNRIKAARQAAEDRLRRQRQDLIVAHMPLAAEIARQVWHRFNRGSRVGLSGRGDHGHYGDRIAMEDMIACANVGLVEAAGRWDPSRGDFAKYAYLRVRGAVIDAHRRQNYVEMLHDSVDQWLQPETGTDAVNLQAKYLTDPAPLPDELAHRDQVASEMARAIDRVLPDDERAVIRLALDGAVVAAIAHELKHSPAWVRTKLTNARALLASALQTRAA